MRGVRRCLPGPCRVHLGTVAEIGVSPRTGAGVPSPPGSPIPTVFPQILALNDPSHGGRMSRALRVPTWGWGAGTPPPYPNSSTVCFPPPLVRRERQERSECLLARRPGIRQLDPTPPWQQGRGAGTSRVPRCPPPGTHGGQEKPLSPPLSLGHPSH